MNPHTQSHATPATVVSQITGLPDLPMPELKALWKKLFQSDAPTHNRQFLERRIAYRLQEIEYRKVNPQLLDRNRRRIQALMETGKNRVRDRDLNLMPGTVLTREFKDRVYRVVVAADGTYEFEGRAYRSLSMIAREITGTRWSGPLFFGVKDSSKKTASKGGRK